MMKQNVYRILRGWTSLAMQLNAEPLLSQSDLKVQQQEGIVWTGNKYMCNTSLAVLYSLTAGVTTLPH